MDAQNFLINKVLYNWFVKLAPITNCLSEEREFTFVFAGVTKKNPSVISLRVFNVRGLKICSLVKQQHVM